MNTPAAQSGTAGKWNATAFSRLGAKWKRIWYLLSCPPGINGCKTLEIETPENPIHGICTWTLEILVITHNLGLYWHHYFLKRWYFFFFSFFICGSHNQWRWKEGKAQFFEQLGQPGGSPSPEGRCLMALPHQVLALVSILVLAPQELIQADNPATNCLFYGQISLLHSICKYCSLSFCSPCIPAFSGAAQCFVILY